jgi:hypothetical protein
LLHTDLKMSAMTAIAAGRAGARPSSSSDAAPSCAGCFTD